jgi:hypothetical protein
MTVDHRDLKPANTCGQCRRGTLRPVDLGGCTWRYRGRDVVVPASFMVDACDRCGAARMPPSMAAEFDRLLGPL